jgi:hypothetical protein
VELRVVEPEVNMYKPGELIPNTENKTKHTTKAWRFDKKNSLCCKVYLFIFFSKD